MQTRKQGSSQAKHRHDRQVEEIPSYLQPYIAKQDPSLYTPIGHASWRFIMKISQAYFASRAHQKYLDGLRETGISSESIPLIEEMDRCLQKFGWRAVAVSGFIPPAVFMEFLSLGVLPIACEMRPLENLAYTPAPDIVHEAAGHAPIIADPEYRDYLRSYGEISRKAIFSSQDMDVYQAVRALSDIKVDPDATPQTIEAAQQRLNRAVESVGEDSEATLLARMGWWTFEYGLVGTIDHPKIFGAGLLSSMGESYHCFDSKVKKIPFSIECIRVSYDITRPQPQLFVASDFANLKKTLEDLGDQMAFRIGGMEGLKKARSAKTVTTTVLDSGVQVSGMLTEILTDSAGKEIYLKYQGPTQLSYADQELDGQGADYHKEGFGTPIEEVTDRQLQDAKLETGKKGSLKFSSGIQVDGILSQVLRKDGKIILLTFDSCRVTRGETILFQPEWGKYDMVCGKKVISVFGGPADRKKYLAATGGFHQEPRKQMSNSKIENPDLNRLYSEVRKIREALAKKESKPETQTRALAKIDLELKKSHPTDWLLQYEILELAERYRLKWDNQTNFRENLRGFAQRSSQELKETIFRGLELI